MIFTERTIRIINGLCTIDNPILLYRGDFNVEIRFTIIDCPYKYTAKDATNVIEATNASYGQLVIKTPNDGQPIFSEVTPTGEDGAIIFTITGDMIDEAIELGDYDFQIRLFDMDKTSRATICPVVGGIKVEEPIAMEDGSTVIDDTNEANVARVNYGVTTTAPALDVFDEDGNYIETTWTDKMLITDARLNKIEDGITGVNQKAAYVIDNMDASNITIADTSNNFTATNVEGALQEVGSQIKDITNLKIDDITLSDNVLTLLANSKTIKTITLPTSTTGGGTNGKEIELQKSTTHIQWRYVGDTEWTNLVALADLKGSKGDKGEQGIQGVKGDKGDTGATPNLQIGEITTLNSGSNATASITGTVENPLLNLGIPKGDKGDTGASSGGIHDTLVTTNISGTTLSLTTDKYQTTTIVDGTEITLPTVTSFVEIHLFFSTTTDLTLILPSCKWQNGNAPTISANKAYEFIFTYTTEWLGGVIAYE